MKLQFRAATETLKSAQDGATGELIESMASLFDGQLAVSCQPEQEIYPAKHRRVEKRYLIASEVAAIRRLTERAVASVNLSQQALARF